MLIVIFVLALPCFTSYNNMVLSQPNISDNEILPIKSVAPAEGIAALPDVEEIPWRLVVFALMLGGLILMFFEIAIIPGFGVTGITGIILIVASMVLAYLKLSVLVGTFVLLFGISAVGFLIYWFSTVFPTTTIGKKFVLNTEETVEDAGIAVDDFEHLVNTDGVTVTSLKPAGKADINGERYDVISEGEFIDKDTPIIVKKSSAGRIIVAKINETNL